MDLIITICRGTRKVKLNKGLIGLNGENLQGNIIVDFTDKSEFVEGTASFEVVQKGERYTLNMTADGRNKVYKLPIKASLLRYACDLTCQVVITQAGTADGVPIFKSETFKLVCLEAVNATSTIPDEYPTWEESANEKLAQVDTAITRAENISADLENKVASDYYKGDKGDKGDQGDKGDNGDNYILTKADLAEIAQIVAEDAITEEWTFTLENSTTVTKKVLVM